MSSADRRAAIGVLRRPHGVRGEISVEPLFEGEPGFFVGKTIRLEGAPGGAPGSLVCETARRHGERWLLRFEGFDSPEAARRLCGGRLTVAPGELPPLEDDGAYHFELVGLLVVDRQGAEIGRVHGIEETAAGDLLVLDDEGKVLIPFRPMVVGIDRENGRIVVELPAGLLDVNRA